jgi:hypothetical protein
MRSCPSRYDASCRNAASLIAASGRDADATAPGGGRQPSSANSPIGKESDDGVVVSGLDELMVSRTHWLAKGNATGMDKRRVLRR